MSQFDEATKVHYGNDNRIEETELERYPRVAEKPISEYSTREVGLQGEMIAAHWCELADYELLERNWRCPSRSTATPSCSWK